MKTVNELPPVTFNKAVKMINGLCEGLGDMMQNEPPKGSGSRDGVNHLHDWVWQSFIWMDSKQGFIFWESIYYLLREIQFGEGMPKI